MATYFALWCCTMNISTNFSYVVLVYGGNHLFCVNLFNSVCKEFEIQKAKVTPPLNVKYWMKLKFLREKLSRNETKLCSEKNHPYSKSPRWKEPSRMKWKTEKRNNRNRQMLVENEKKRKNPWNVQKFQKVKRCRLCYELATKQILNLKNNYKMHVLGHDVKLSPFVNKYVSLHQFL